MNSSQPGLILIHQPATHLLQHELQPAWFDLDVAVTANVIGGDLAAQLPLDLQALPQALGSGFRRQGAGSGQ